MAEGLLKLQSWGGGVQNIFQLSPPLQRLMEHPYYAHIHLPKLLWWNIIISDPKELHCHMEDSLAGNLYSRCSGFIRSRLDATDLEIKGELPWQPDISITMVAGGPQLDN